MSHRSHLQLPAWHKGWLWVAGLGLLLSGSAWLAVHYLVGAGAAEDALPHPAEAWLMRLHGLGVFAGLFVSGLLAGGHVGHGWRHTRRHGRRGRRLGGLLLCAVLALLVASGYALYYLVPEGARAWVGWVHAGLGLSLTAGVFWHARRSAYTAGIPLLPRPPPRV